MATVRSDGDAGGLDAPLIECGALTVGLAHAVAATGADVLVIDADACGTRLGQRVAAATRTRLSTAQRGMPTLAAARSDLNADTVVRHCWALRGRDAAAGAGSVLLAAAPTHPEGARHAADLLGERADALAALGGRFTVLVSLPGPVVEPYRRLADAASLSVDAAARAGTAAPGGLRAVLAAFGRPAVPDPVTKLRVAGRAVGLVGPVRDSVLLGAAPRRAERGPLEALRTAAVALTRIGGLR